jgi:hypothetical protein
LLFNREYFSPAEVEKLINPELYPMHPDNLGHLEEVLKVSIDVVVPVDRLNEEEAFWVNPIRISNNNNDNKDKERPSQGVITLLFHEGQYRGVKFINRVAPHIMAGDQISDQGLPDILAVRDNWVPAFEEWVSRSIDSEYFPIYRPIELIGEDRTFGNSSPLFVDLIPKNCWFSNVRTNIHPNDWSRLRHNIYQRVNYQCEGCGVTGSRLYPLEAHERWSYDSDRKIQKLERIVAFCHWCHMANHLGYAEISGVEDRAIAHLQKVRGFSDQELSDHIKEAWDLWNERNKVEWELDLSIIIDSGIRVIRVDPGDKKDGDEEEDDVDDTGDASGSDDDTGVIEDDL